MKRFISFILILSTTLTSVACGQSTEVENVIEEENNSDAERIAELERELAKLKENSQTEIKEESVQSEKEAPEEPDMLMQYIMGLSIEHVEMTMGATHLLELEQDIPNAVWSSSDENVVLAANGQLKAITPGNATITLSTDVRDISFNVTVNSFPDLTLAVNYFTTMEINDAITDVRWESSVPEIVSVENGVITSLASGASNITAYIGEVPYTFEVVATTPDITTTSVRKIIGNTQQVSILGTNGKVEWKSDNTAIATVSDTGLITAEGTGAGQSTVVHAYVDGMEFKIDVAVEPIPQLSSTYKIYGHQNSTTYKNAKVALCTNANETMQYSREYEMSPGGAHYGSQQQEVLNVADIDYSDGWTFPVYRTFNANKDDIENYAEIYLVGTSQTADVLVKQSRLYFDVEDDSRYASFVEMVDDGVGTINSNSAIVTYEPCDNYGVIRFYGDTNGAACLVTVSVDGYLYRFIVTSMDIPYTGNGRRFDYSKIDNYSANYMIEECSVDAVVVSNKVNVNYDSLSSSSRTYFSGDEWVERIGTKFVEAVEDEAISMAAGFLLKAIFL